MSWDILILNSIKPVDFEQGDWPNFDLRESVINKIKATFPDSNWKDSSWGMVENAKAIIEFNVGDDEDIGNNFMIHVRGGENPSREIIKMCKQNNWIAYDISGDLYLDDANPSANSFKEWADYKDQVVNANKPGGNFGENFDCF